MFYWPFSTFKAHTAPTEMFDIEPKMADHTTFAKRVRKSLYYGEYSDASLPSLSVTDVAVEVLNNAAPPRKRLLDRKYAHSVARRAKISPCTLMMGMLYAERLRQKNSKCTKTLSSSDVFLISIMVASKYLYDEGEEEEVYNEDWAKAGSKTIQDINKLEMEFLQMMDWNLFISKDEFSNFVSQVESRVSLTKGISRGWLTYHDMSTLLDNVALRKMLCEIKQQLLKNISTCLAAYILGISILFGSSTLTTPNHGRQQTRTSSSISTQEPSVNCATTNTSSCVFSQNSTNLEPQETSGVHVFVSQRMKEGINSFQSEIRHLENAKITKKPKNLQNNIEQFQNPRKKSLETPLININNFFSLWPTENNTYSQNLESRMSPFCGHHLNENVGSYLRKRYVTNSSKSSSQGCFAELLLSRESSIGISCFQEVCAA